MGDNEQGRPGSGLAFEDPRTHPAVLRLICRRLDELKARVDRILPETNEVAWSHEFNRNHEGRTRFQVEHNLNPDGTVRRAALTEVQHEADAFDQAWADITFRMPGPILRRYSAQVRRLDVGTPVEHTKLILQLIERGLDSMELDLAELVGEANDRASEESAHAARINEGWPGGDPEDEP